MTMIYRCIGYEQIAVTTAKTLTAAKVTPSTLYARIQVQTAPIRASYDGTAPVGGSIGEYFDIDDVFEVWGAPDMLALKMIKDGATGASVEVYYFG